MVIALYHDMFSSRCHILDTGNNLIEIKKRSSGYFPEKNIRIIFKKISDYFLRKIFRKIFIII